MSTTLPLHLSVSPAPSMTLQDPRPLPELERVSLHLQLNNSSQSCKLRATVTAAPCNLPSCRLHPSFLQSAGSLVASFLGGSKVCVCWNGSQSCQQATTGTSLLTFQAQMVWTPPKINVDLWKSLEIASLTSMGNRLPSWIWQAHPRFSLSLALVELEHGGEHL